MREGQEMVSPGSGHVSKPARIVRPSVPVEHLQLWCWFYPGAGDGGLQLARWTEGHSTDPDYKHVHEQPLTFITADLVVPAMIDHFADGVARLTEWQLLSDSLRKRYGEPRAATFLDPPRPPTLT